MRKVFLFLLILISVNASAQWTIINGNQRFAKGLGIPTRDTFISANPADTSQIVLRPQDSAIYIKYKGTWRKVSGGTGGSGTVTSISQGYGITNSTNPIINTGTISIDSATLSAKYLRVADTTNMLNKYVRKAENIDTTSLSNRINLRVKYTDTAAMLAPYLQNANYDFQINLGYQALGSSVKCVPLSCPTVNMMTNSAALTDNQARYIAVYVPKATTITGVRWFQVAAGSYTADQYNGVALYSYSGGTLTKVDSSANDGNIWVSANNTWTSKAFYTTYTAAAGVYYIGFVYNSSAQTTAPTIGANATTVSGTVNTFDFTNGGKTSATNTLTNFLPTTISTTTIISSTNNIGVWLY
jgi:hypothetical protein